MFFLTKYFFKYIVKPILMILLIPMIVFIWMYQPLDFYYEDTSLEGISFNDILSDGLERFSQSENEERRLTFSMHEDNVNYYILSVLNETNLDLESENKYFIEDEFYGYAGSWISFQEDDIEIISKIDVFITPTMTYETSLRITFDLLFDGDQIILDINNMYIGNLPILWMFDVAAFGLSLFGIELEDEISTIFNQFGTYQHESKILTISVSDLINASMSETQTVQSVLALLKGIQNNHLLRLETEDQILSLIIDAYMLEDSTDILNLEEEDTLQSYEDVFQNWYTSVSYIELFQEALNVSDQGLIQYTIEMQALELNQIMDIALADRFPNTINIGSYGIQLNQPYLVIEDELWIEIPIQIYSDIASPIFTTKIKLNASLLYEDDQVLLNFNDIEIGEAVFDHALLSVLFQLFDGQIEENQLDITPLLDVLNESISIHAISISLDKIHILIQPTTSTSSIIDLVEQSIYELQLTETLPEVIQTQLEVISNTILTNNVEDMNQAFEDFMLIYEGLDDTIQSEIQSIIYTYLDETMILETLLN